MDWSIFFAFLAALCVWDVMRGIPEFLLGFKHGWREARAARAMRNA